MKRITKEILYKFGIFCLMPMLILISQPLQAQMMNPGSSGNNDKNKNGLELDLYGEVTLEYTDNVYRLTEDQQTRMETNDRSDILSGRFKDMDSIWDYIIEPRIGLRLDSNSPIGGELRLTTWVRYNYYIKNKESGFPESRIRLRNSIGKNGAFTLEGNFLRGFFKKNYLSAVNDTNGNGNIPRDERIYSSATYDEYEGIIEYEHEIIKDKDKSISGLDIRPFMGYGHRSYNSTFGNRNRDITFEGLELDFEFNNRIDLEVIYMYEKVSSPDQRELVLFDETRSGTDVNGDGVIRSNAPLVTPIDRSADRHGIEINPSFKLSKDILLFAGYSKRTSSYTSDNQLDIEHYNQKARRQRINAGIRYDFSKALSGEIEYRQTDEENEEDGDYSQKDFMLTVRYNFSGF